MPKRLAGFDLPLVASVLALLAGSIYVLMTAIPSATGHGLTQFYGQRQIVFVVVGLALGVAASRVPLSGIERLWLPVYLGTLGSIAIVFVLGTAIRGSKRWIMLGPINLQPSEAGKILIVLAAAGFITSRMRDARSPLTFVGILAFIGLPAALVYLQPDFGTSQVYGYVALGMLFFAGAKWLHFTVLASSFVVLLIIVLGLLPAVGIQVMKDYQVQRFTGFLDPEADPRGTNYQAIQAKKAIGSGQLTGKPASEASQVSLGFLPEPQTDFIFATLSERYGFMGAIMVLALYILLISRCLRAVAVAPTYYGRLVCGGVTIMFAAQVITNIGMVIGLLPITGVPLPLFSYGGSAMFANLVAVGFVAGVLRESESPQVRYARRVGPTLARARTSHRTQQGSVRGRFDAPRSRSRRNRSRV